MSAIEKSESNVVSLVKADAEYIKNEIHQANQAFGKSLEHYRNAGERLATVRDDFKNKKKIQGQGFQIWVEQNCQLSRRSAYGYIAIFEEWNLIVQRIAQSGDVFTLTDALKAIQDIKSPRLQAEDEAIDTVAREVHDQLAIEQRAIEQAKLDIQKQQDVLKKQQVELKSKQSELAKQQAKFELEKQAELKKAQEDAKKLADKLLKEAENIKQNAELDAKKIIKEANEKSLKLPQEKAKRLVQQAELEAKEISDKAQLSMKEAERIYHEAKPPLQ